MRTESFKVEIQPLRSDMEPILATVKPLISKISGGAGTVEILDGYEVTTKNKRSTCYPHEMDELLESGQYKRISQPPILKNIFVKKGQKFKNRYNRRIVYYKGKYKELHSGKIVINYTHPHRPTEVGALYKLDFLKFYKPA